MGKNVNRRKLVGVVCIWGWEIGDRKGLKATLDDSVVLDRAILSVLLTCAVIRIQKYGTVVM